MDFLSRNYYTLLPWLILGPVLLIMVLVFRYATKLQKEEQNKKARFLATGKRAKATVLEIRQKGNSSGGSYAIADVDLEVKPEGSSTFKMTVNITTPILNAPRRGDEVDVAYDPSNVNDIVLF